MPRKRFFETPEPKTGTHLSNYLKTHNKKSFVKPITLTITQSNIAHKVFDEMSHPITFYILYNFYAS